MPLQGTFDVFDFGELMLLLGSKRLTGRLHARSGGATANFYFDDGYLTAADAGDTAPGVGPDVRDLLERLCFELLDTDKGSFEFHPAPATWRAQTKVKPDAVLAKARQRVEEWRVLQAAIPSLDAQPRVVADLGAEQVTFSRERWRLVTAIDGRRSLRAIARTLSLSDYEVCRLVKSLIDDGVVEMRTRQSVTIPPPDGPVGKADLRVAGAVLDGEDDDGDAAAREKVTSGLARLRTGRRPNERVGP